MAPGARTRSGTTRLISHIEVNAAMSTSPRILAAGMEKAKRAQAIWRSHSPVFNPDDPREKRKRPPHGQPEDYRNSILIKVIRTRLRIAWRVETADYRRFWIEFGAKHMPKYAPREKALAEMKRL